MKTLFRIFVLLLLLGGWALAAASLHLVRTTGPVPWVGNLILMPKDHLGYRETYADARNWTPADLASHPAIINRLQELRRTDVLDRIERVPVRITQPSATQPAEATALQNP